MTKPILDPEFWKQRLQEVRAKDQELHNSIYKCDFTTWEDIENHHRRILKHLIHPRGSILDAGCGYGRLLTMLPDKWNGDYLGVDISPDFIELAENEHLEIGTNFIVGSLLSLRKDLKHRNQVLYVPAKFDWCVCNSVRLMVIDNLGEAAWSLMLDEIKPLCKKILFLEYSLTDKGEVLEC